jgi:hypothetical protein
MKTKFILHGGFIPGEKQENDGFTKEILKDTPEKVRILLVYFAKELHRIPDNKAEDITQFNKHKGNKEFIFEVATEELFEGQTQEADIVYLHGGASAKILEVLKKFSNLPRLLQGKIVASDSAGVNVLSKAFHSVTNGQVSEGLGILPFKVICHYKEEYKDKLADIYPELETVFLPELEFKVYEYDIIKT